MNIYILHAPNTYNYGSMMMAENFIYYFEKASEMSNKYYIETDDIENTEARLRAATQIDNIHGVQTFSLYEGGCVSKKDLLKAEFLGKNVLSGFASEMDAVIVLGGDDYTEDYGWKALVSQLFKVNALTRKLKVYFIGQTMGPFYSFRKPVAGYFLGKVSRIMVRDKITYDYLEKMKLKNMGEIPDLALMPLARETEANGKEKMICLFPSQLIYSYSASKSRSECLSFYKKVCRTIFEKYPEHKLVLAAHVLKPESSDDRTMVRDIYDLLEEAEKGRIIKLDNEMLPFEIRKLIKASELVISARMHPIVSSLECGTPWICFSYSRKYWGILGEGFKMGDYILDVRGITFDQLFDKFTALLTANMDMAAERLKDTGKRVREEQDKILKEISLLAGEIRK